MSARAPCDLDPATIFIRTEPIVVWIYRKAFWSLRELPGGCAKPTSRTRFGVCGGWAFLRWVGAGATLRLCFPV
ncbi:hypothetical protein CspHIS471_0305510 [Cutaneotrichosporon sp. HIS471]|nr:hypothetical protein CspHIS471_0305510 [Cutaneotrichosporon sp. HIS471]